MPHPSAWPGASCDDRGNVRAAAGRPSGSVRRRAGKPHLSLLPQRDVSCSYIRFHQYLLRNIGAWRRKRRYIRRLFFRQAPIIHDLCRRDRSGSLLTQRRTRRYHLRPGKTAAPRRIRAPRGTRTGQSGTPTKRAGRLPQPCPWRGRGRGGGGLGGAQVGQVTSAGAGTGWWLSRHAALSGTTRQPPGEVTRAAGVTHRCAAWPQKELLPRRRDRWLRRAAVRGARSGAGGTRRRRRRRGAGCRRGRSARRGG